LVELQAALQVMLPAQKLGVRFTIGHRIKSVTN
jgi:hypothetical protein